MNEELLQRLRDINPEPSRNSDTDELAAVFATIDVRRSVMATEERTTTATETRQLSWQRNAVALIGTMVIVLLIVGGGVLLLGRSVEQVVGGEPTAEAPPTTQTAPPTSSPETTTSIRAPEPVAAPMTWSKVALGEAGARGEINTITLTNSGLIAGGFEIMDGIGRVAALWTSEDGAAWERIQHDDALFGGDAAHVVTAIAAGDTGYVAVGSNGREGVVWTSVDGYVWERVPHSASFVGDGWIKMAAVTYGPAGYVAVGYESKPDNEHMISRGVAWISPEGVTWERVDSELFTLGLMDDVAVGDFGYVAVGLDWTPSGVHAGVWISPDGYEWSQTDVAADRGGPTMQGVVVTEGLIVATGNYSPDLVVPAEEDCGGAAMWLSADAVTWVPVPNDDELFCTPFGAWANAVAASDGRIVAVGESKAHSVWTSQAGVWVSDDAGTTWHQIETPAETFGTDPTSVVIMHDVVIIDDVFVAVGVYDNETTVWTGTWNEDNGS